MNRNYSVKLLERGKFSLSALAIVLVLGFWQWTALAETENVSLEGGTSEDISFGNVSPEGGTSEDISFGNVSPETGAILEHLEQESRKAEERFRIALKEQKDAAESRERILIGIFIAIVLMVVAGILIYNKKGKKKSHSRANPSSYSVAASDSNTVIQKPVGNAEYVLDGRDEDGVRYVLTLTGTELTDPEGIVVGRNPVDTRYLINHEDVSRRHARMSMSNSRLFVEDLGSTNGTSVNGQSIDDKGSVAIANGDQIIIGSVVMKLDVVDD